MNIIIRTTDHAGCPLSFIAVDNRDITRHPSKLRRYDSLTDKTRNVLFLYRWNSVSRAFVSGPIRVVFSPHTHTHEIPGKPSAGRDRVLPKSNAIAPRDRRRSVKRSSAAAHFSRVVCCDRRRRCGRDAARRSARSPYYTREISKPAPGPTRLRGGGECERGGCGSATGPGWSRVTPRAPRPPTDALHVRPPPTGSTRGRTGTRRVCGRDSIDRRPDAGIVSRRSSGTCELVFGSRARTDRARRPGGNCRRRVGATRNGFRGVGVCVRAQAGLYRVSSTTAVSETKP